MKMVENSDLDNDQDIYLIAGATGKTGVHITKALVARGKIVRIIVRSATRAKTLLADVFDKLESVVTCDIVNDNDYGEKLKKALESSKGKVVSHVISTLSYNWDKTISPYDGNVTSNERLIDACVKSKIVKKFVFLSSSHVRRPWSYVSLTCNIIKPELNWHKVIAEDLVRKSGINYLIVRPVGLSKNIDLKETGYTIDQGDRVEGMIHRSTVGRLIVDTMLDPNIPDNTSYECISYAQDFQKEYSYTNGGFKLRCETEEEKQKVDHIIPKKVVLLSIFMAISFTFYMVGKFISNKRIFQRFFK